MARRGLSIALRRMAGTRKQKHTRCVTPFPAENLSFFARHPSENAWSVAGIASHSCRKLVKLAFERTRESELSSKAVLDSFQVPNYLPAYTRSAKNLTNDATRMSSQSWTRSQVAVLPFKVSDAVALRCPVLRQVMPRPGKSHELFGKFETHLVCA
eukprot:267176-Rhodomonas_salina.1